MRGTLSPVRHTYTGQVVIDTDRELSLCVTIPSAPLHTIDMRTNLTVFPHHYEEYLAPASVTHIYTGHVEIETDRELSPCVTTHSSPIHTIDQETGWQCSHIIMRRTQSPVTHIYTGHVVIETDRELYLNMTIPSSPILSRPETG